ncbi:sensor histidine kinase [Magnetospirillum sulfuroxidans]|uniref:histidine kinase n=1 Tax=Magnetospirillum sulfuroxidans TaxID=611300 RepID=A0ABS5IDA9_9PROT|nr:PAS domain-containing sensor histidine kinase [Magnetospirillum sulfuroxidans]MBR9971673.1 PAS domain-containing sensor histidine kinase [Magnetospirillum sulfuroxidans]
MAWPCRLLICLMAALLWMTPPAKADADVTALLSTTLNNHSSIMLLIEPETGAILDANDAASHFYGYSLPQLRLMRIQDINTLGPDEVGAERRRAKAEKRNYFIFPHRLASGELRTVEVYSAPLHDGGGHTLLLSIIHDITGKTVADSELAAYRTRLEELLTRRTSEALEAQSRLRFWMTLGLALQTVLIVALVIAVIRRHAAVKEVEHEAHTRRRAEEKLAVANADLQRFAEIAAHHLQEPTRRLMVFSQRLAKLLGSPPNENIAFSLATIEEQASYLHALVRDVQVYLAAASPLGPMIANDPARIIDQIRADQRARFSEHDTAFQIDPLPPVLIDAPRLRYLLTALLDNCLRHARPATPVRIHISGQMQNGRSILRIADNGPGIPLEFRTRVLEVFEHLHSQADSQPGTGLGLAVVRRIVESCDGHILIEDSPAGGVLIVIDLPGETL